MGGLAIPCLKINIKRCGYHSNGRVLNSIPRTQTHIHIPQVHITHICIYYTCIYIHIYHICIYTPHKSHIHHIHIYHICTHIHYTGIYTPCIHTYTSCTHAHTQAIHLLCLSFVFLLQECPTRTETRVCFPCFSCLASSGFQSDSKY